MTQDRETKKETGAKQQNGEGGEDKDRVKEVEGEKE